jgi:hypothetical protein
MRQTFLILPLLLLALTLTAAGQAGDSTSVAVCASCIRGNLEYLAGPALHGRGSGTIDEYHAAQYIAGKLKAYGLTPAAENDGFIQTGSIKSRSVTTAPVLTFDVGKPVSWKHGTEFAAFQFSQPDIAAPLQKLDLNDTQVSPESVKEGAAVLLKLKPGTGVQDIQNVFGPYLESKAAVIIVPEPADGEARFRGLASRLPRDDKRIGDAPAGPDGIILMADQAQQLWGAADGTLIKLHAEVTPWQVSNTWNVLGKIAGKKADQIVLLSAHLDHLGVEDGKTYPGADDDASGTVAVMELARALAEEPRPQRTIVFALWGSEEAGLVGARYFLKHPTFELKNIITNLEFEMIARPDPKVQPNQLWLTGWERTDLGPVLAQHGAQLVGDPHPDQSFFMRSDNYALAKTGIIAQTVSSYGLHKDYHEPTDTLDKVDWQHLDSAVGSMIAPVSWLANSEFTPKWNAGRKP